MFPQLSLEARGIATKGMQHGLLGGMAQMIEDKDAELIVMVGLTHKVHLLYHNLFSSLLSSEVIGVAIKGMQHGLLGGIVQMIEDKETNSQGLIMIALC